MFYVIKIRLISGLPMIEDCCKFINKYYADKYLLEWGAINEEGDKVAFYIAYLKE